MLHITHSTSFVVYRLDSWGRGYSLYLLGDKKWVFLLSPRVFNLNRSTGELFMTEDNVLSVLELVSLRCEKKSKLEVLVKISD